MDCFCHGMKIELDRIDPKFEPPSVPVKIRDDFFYSITRRLFDCTLLNDENTVKGWFVLKDDRDLNTFCFDVWLYVTKNSKREVSLIEIKRKVLLYHVGNILLSSNPGMTLQNFNRRIKSKTPVTKDEFQELKNRRETYCLSTYLL